jgi:hypothetical protein
MGRRQPFDAFGRGQKTDEADVLHTASLQPVDCSDGRIGGREHRVHHDHQAFCDVRRGLEVVLDRLQRLRIAIKPDMSDARARDEIEHAVEKADAGAQDRREHELLAGDRRLHGLGQRRFDFDELQRQIAGHLIGEQHADLVEKLAEPLGRNRFVAHQRQLVLHEGVADDVNVRHGGLLNRDASTVDEDALRRLRTPAPSPAL